jgi:glycosyltransferase involved in cell wall biosynthesis
MTRIWPSAQAPSAGIFVANRFRGVPDVTVLVAPSGWRWPIGLVRFIWRGLRARGPFDGVEAHVLYPAGFAALVVARLRRVPLLAYAHGTDVREARSRGRGFRFFVTAVARHADLVVTNSPESARLVQVLGGAARVIPPGIDTDLFRPAPRPPRDRRRVLYLGGTNPGKGYQTARRLADTLIGPGLRDVTPAEVARLYAEHDVVLVPSIAEAFGLVAAEAIAAGRWVVAADVGGLSLIVQDGVNGTLVSDGRYAAALAGVPDYDPFAIAPTVQQHSLSRWQEQMAAAWTELLERRTGSGSG